MIVGYFDLDGAPIVLAYAAIERLQMGGRVEFLVDTGADSTALHPADAKRLGCDFDALGTPIPVGGIGGSHEYCSEPATITLESDDGDYETNLEIDIAIPDDDNDDLPSLLGRNIIISLRMEYNYNTGILHFHQSASIRERQAKAAALIVAFIRLRSSGSNAP